jgi:predicted aminopeptidase
MITGEISILANRAPITELLADEATPEPLKQYLREVQEMREFAVYELGLPATKSYTTYVDIGRRFAQWVLTATPEFSVSPKTWCFPFVGCSSYLVFFDEEMAKQSEKDLRDRGYDASFRGATAYSTGGWFSDPLLNTILELPDYARAGVIFHEMAHEKLHVKKDTAFTEAFAVFVGETGQQKWIIRHYGNEAAEKFLVRTKRNDDFSQLMKNTRMELKTLYRKNIAPEKMRVLKQETFAEMQVKYAALKKTWDGYPGFDNWMTKKFNNADIVGTDEYTNLVPFFKKLFKLSEENLGVFYEKAEAIANLPKMERYLEIEKILSE